MSYNPLLDTEIKKRVHLLFSVSCKVLRSQKVYDLRKNTLFKNISKNLK